MNNQTVDISSILIDTSSELSVAQRITTISLIVPFVSVSLVCFIIIFYHFIRLHKVLLLDRINHHVILCILISDFLLLSTELPFSLHYLATGRVLTPKICQFWIFWDYTLEMLSLYLTTLVSIERYLLVFHNRFIIRHKILLHYIPLGFVILYAFGIYIYLILLSPCDPTYEYDLASFVCGGACYLNSYVPALYDTIADTALPTFVLLFFNLLIIIRVITIKRRVTPTMVIVNIWKKNQRMILQLLAISLMPLITWMPWVVIILIESLINPSFGEDFIAVVINYLPYFTSSLSPFLALIGLPEIRENLKKIKKPSLFHRRAIASSRV